MSVDYSVYLVTDSGLVPPNRTLFETVQQSIENGATIVQLREKDIDTKDFITKAQEIHNLTRKAGIPLIINDRVDVALAIDAEGIHVGQDDMPVELVRKLIGPGKIIGLSTRTVEEARAGIATGVIDYIGIGAVFSTATKDLKDRGPIGAKGVREVLKVLRDEGGEHIKTVVIGGINDKNVQSVLYTSAIPGKSVDGAAVVSNIIAADDPGLVTAKLSKLIKGSYESTLTTSNTFELKPNSKFVHNVTEIAPMTHQITNNVVKGFSANVTLAIGASPIMAEEQNDFSDLSKFPNAALLLNTGTTHPSEIYLKAVRSYNLNGNPVILDPVGAGATEFRRKLTQDVLNAGHFTIIKGNEGEIFTAAGIKREMKGVDSIGSEPLEKVVEAAKRLALDTRSIVVVTGKTDIIVEGELSGEFSISKEVKQRAIAITGGHPLMGKVTGSGCSLGSVLASYVGANREDPFIAAITAVSLYKHAGGVAGKTAEKNGPGSFLGLFLDELYKTTEENKPEDWDIKIEVL